MTNREQLERLYGEWAQGNMSREDLFDPEIESASYGMFPDGREETSHGLERLGQRMAEWMRTWERPATLEAERIVADGDARFCALIRWRGRGRASGAPFEAEGAHIWEFRDGRAIRFDIYRDREEALTAFRDLSSG